MFIIENLQPERFYWRMADKLNRTLSLPQLCFYGIGSMVGAGIYSVIGAAGGEAGNFLWISFLFSGIAAFITVLSYAELSSFLPKAGAEYQFLKAGFPKWRVLAFMAGFMIALNATATSATVALAFGGYLNVFIDVPIAATAFALLVLCTLVNIAGIRQSTWVGIGLILVEVAGLLLIIYAGFTNGDIHKPFAKMPDMNDVTGIFAATALVFFIYIGFEDVANLSEESKQPKKNIPRALIISVIITSIIYFLVAISVIALVDPVSLTESKSPLTAALGGINPLMGQALAVAALFATASTALISLISISRLLYGMASDNAMPSYLAKVLPARRTPYAAALTLFAAACLLLPLGEIKITASVSSFGVLSVFIGVQAAAIALRFKQPNAPRRFKMPLSIGRMPLLPPIGIIISVALITHFDPIVYVIGFGTMFLGFLVFVISKKKIKGK
jgi:basic amino acid/polyamine antiporter, APA family